MAMVATTSVITPIGIARRSSLSRSLGKRPICLSLWSDQVNRPIPQRTGACLPAEDLYSSQMIDSFLNRSRQTFLLIDHCKPFYAYLPLCALNRRSSARRPSDLSRCYHLIKSPGHSSRLPPYLRALEDESTPYKLDDPGLLFGLVKT